VVSILSTCGSYIGSGEAIVAVVFSSLMDPLRGMGRGYYGRVGSRWVRAPKGESDRRIHGLSGVCVCAT
jgi:hypothetical protein